LKIQDRKPKGVRRLAGSSLNVATDIEIQPCLPTENAAVELSFRRTMRKAKEGLDRKKRLFDKALEQASAGRTEGILCDGDEYSYPFSLSVDDTIRTWPEVRDVLSPEEWKLFYRGFFSPRTAKDINASHAATKKLARHIWLCGNNETAFPELKTKVHLVSRGATYAHASAEKKEELREMQRFAISDDYFQSQLTAQEKQILDAFIDTWSEQLTAIGLDLQRSIVDKAVDKVQRLACKLQFALKAKGQPLSAAWKSLGAKIYDDGFLTLLETD